MRTTFLHSSPSLGFWFIVDLIQTVISCWKAIEAVQNHLNKPPFVTTTMNNPQADEAIFNWLINFVFSEVLRAEDALVESRAANCLWFQFFGSCDARGWLGESLLLAAWKHGNWNEDGLDARW